MYVGSSQTLEDNKLSAQDKRQKNNNDTVKLFKCTACFKVGLNDIVSHVLRDKDTYIYGLMDNCLVLALFPWQLGTLLLKK